MKNFHLLVVFFSLITGSLKAQDCSDYHRYHCLYADYTFIYSQQSRSLLFRKGQTSEIKIAAKEGEDYYVAVCAHRKFGDIRFRILEDNEGRKLIYDNAPGNYRESFIFSNAITRNLIVEITVPEGDGKNFSERRCVGVVVEYRKTPDQGEK